MKVMLDPGHGGSNKGAYCNPLVERTLNVQLALTIARHLNPLHEVDFTRVDDISVKNSHRAVMANRWGADVFISVHHNAWHTNRANGFEVLYYPRSKRGFKLAWLICDDVTRHWDIRNRGPKGTDRLIVLRGTRMPAILIEAGFISSVTDRFVSLYTPAKRVQFYDLIGDAVLKALEKI